MTQNQNKVKKRKINWSKWGGVIFFVWILIFFFLALFSIREAFEDQEEGACYVGKVKIGIEVFKKIDEYRSFQELCDDDKCRDVFNTKINNVSQ